MPSFEEEDLIFSKPFTLKKFLYREVDNNDIMQLHGGENMIIESIKKCLGFFDYILLIAAVYMFSHFDYSNLDIVEIVYIVSFTLWFGMLATRVYITYTGKNKGGKKLK